jgi:UPF0716 protein FxsA
VAEGRLPTQSLLHGLLILIAGAVLLTPGLITDLVGFFLLIPAGRRWVAKLVVSWFDRQHRIMDSGVIDVEWHRDS